jgi:outer membrane protein insertion porin family
VERLSAAPLLAALALLAAAPAPGPEWPVASEVILQLPPGEDAASLEGMVPLKVGQALSPRALRRTVQLLYDLGRFSNVLVRTRPVNGPPGEKRVVVEIECLPRRVIRAVSFRADEGSLSLSLDTLRAAANLPEGEELYAERLEAAVEGVQSAYRRRGYRHARVSARDDGARAASIEIETLEGKLTRVASLSLGPDLGLPRSEIEGRLRTRAGGILNLGDLDEDLQTLRAALRHAGFYRAKVMPPVVEEAGETAGVRIPLEAGPRIFFRFTGNVSFSSEELREQLGYDEEEPLDAPAVEATATRLADFLRARGFLETRVRVGELSREGSTIVLYRIEEGRRYRLGAVRFSGTAVRPPEQLRRQLMEALQEEAAEDTVSVRVEMDELAAIGGAPVQRPARTFRQLDPTATYYEPNWSRAINRILEAYREDGYLEAAYEGTRLSLDAAGGVVDVDIRLREGVQTRIRSVEVEGQSALSLAELTRELKVAAGDPLSFARVEQSRLALLERYARAGHAYARVEEAEELSEDRRGAVVRFRVTEGPEVRVASVTVAGARRTREEVIRGTLALRPGDLYEPDAVARSQAGLLSLGVFRSVMLRVNDPELPEASKDLTVEVNERPWQTVSSGLGFSIADGPRAFLEYSQPNLGGRALEFSARGKINYLLDSPLAPRPDLEQKPAVEHLEGRADVGLHYPRIHFLPFTAGGRLDLIAERLHRRAYDLARASSVLGFDWMATSRITFSLQYEFEVDHILKRTSSATLTRADIETLRFPEGVTTLHSLRPSINLDFRDNSSHPRRGWFASAVLEIMHSLGSPGSKYFLGLVPGSDVYTNLIKGTLTLSGYLPVGSRSVLALSARAGQIYPLDVNSQTIAPKRFFLGGTSTMRGYGEEEMVPEEARAIYADQRRRCAGSMSGLACSGTARQLVNGQTLVSEGGNSFLLLKAELRVPIQGSLEAGLFTDIGNLWFDHTAIDPTGSRFLRLHVNVGAGLRFITPIGPAVLDLGFNLSPDPQLNESRVAPHFAIGLF